MAHGTRWGQLDPSERLGAGAQGQSVDQTQPAVTVAGYASDGVTLTKTTLPTKDVLIGDGGNVYGNFPVGAWYGQVPRGTIDGSNTVFTLDYQLGSPYTILTVNGDNQKPPRDGQNANPTPDYAISGYTLTYRYPLKTTDWHYIWYFIAAPAPTTAPTVSGLVLYLTTAHFPSSSGTIPNFGAGASTQPVSTISPVPDWFHSTSGWAKRTDANTLSGTNLTNFLNGTFSLLLMLENDGSAVGAFTPAEEFWIYDCYAIATLSDGSTQTWRPTAYTQLIGSGTAGNVVNPANMLDNDDTSYAVLSASSYGGAGLNGVFVNLNSFAPVTSAALFGGNVDQINGGSNPPGTGATGSTGTLTVADQIAADMTGTNEGHPHGVPSSWDLYSGPVLNGVPAGTGAVEWWSGLYVDSAGNPATNTQISVKNVQMWWYDTSLSQWVNGLAATNTFDGGYYNEDFSGTELSKIVFTSQTDGSRSYGTVSGKVAHCYTPFPRIPINYAHFGGLVVLAEAKLVLINPAGTDDRASAKLLFLVGADPYPTTTGAGIDNNPGICGGKLKYVTTSWRSFAATTMSQAALEAAPPPIDLTGISG